MKTSQIGYHEEEGREPKVVKKELNRFKKYQLVIEKSYLNDINLKLDTRLVFPIVSNTSFPSETSSDCALKEGATPA